MAVDPLVWRCPVCEGVNRGGRVCTTCGERLPDGYVPADAAARSAPTVTAPPAPSRAPTAPRRPVGTPLPRPAEIFGTDPYH